jgi:hypothetical protein
MLSAMQAAAETTHSASLTGQGSDLVLGYIVVCAVPVVFWTLLFAAVSWMFGFPITGPTLFATGLAIGGLMAAVFSALIVNPRT